MNAFPLALTHGRIQLLDLFRSPGYVIPTVTFPALFFALFALPYARSGAPVADFEVLSYIVFAVVGVALYQFGVGIAADRGRPWERYLRTLPVSSLSRFGGRILSAMAFGLMAGATVALVARFFTPVDLSIAQWGLVFVYAMLGGVPFVLMGITIGYWASARAAVPIATAINLLLAYAGGLWLPPNMLPGPVQAVSVWLPTRQFAELLWSVAGQGNAGHAAIVLVWYAAIFTGLAALGYRRDEHTRYA
jgi:ABC-2 type transport system permease protein